MDARYVYSSLHSRVLYTHQLRKAYDSTIVPPAHIAEHTLLEDFLWSC